MEIRTNNYSIAEIIGQLNRDELRVNRDYQRGAGLWPPGPRSYFIDTILTNFPFPKIYIHETYDRVGQQVRRELVDGQQRIGAIADFVKDKFSISGDSDFRGCKFSDLDDEQTAAFMSYTVSCDVIRNATRGDILQMFRRMNAYTLPLNEAEKRHSTFHGDFKWYVNGIVEEINEFLAMYIFTPRQIVRMADSELISEITLSLVRGVVSTSPTDLRNLYKANDNNFAQANDYKRIIVDQFMLVNNNLPVLTRSYMMKPYALHMLIVALAHVTVGVPAIRAQIEGVDGPIPLAWNVVEERLLALAQAHETKDEDGPFARYVWGCLGGTNRAPRRMARILEIFTAMGYTPTSANTNDIPDFA